MYTSSPIFPLYFQREEGKETLYVWKPHLQVLLFLMREVRVNKDEFKEVCNKPKDSGPAPLQKYVKDFCCVNVGRFCWGFSWRMILLGTLPTQKWRNGDKLHKNPAAQKYKSVKSRLCHDPPWKMVSTYSNQALVIKLLVSNNDGSNSKGLGPKIHAIAMAFPTQKDKEERRASPSTTNVIKIITFRFEFKRDSVTVTVAAFFEIITEGYYLLFPVAVLIVEEQEMDCNELHLQQRKEFDIILLCVQHFWVFPPNGLCQTQTSLQNSLLRILA